jgi:hypothetical protein
MYYCPKCNKKHNPKSKIGRRHLKYSSMKNPPTDPELQRAIQKRIQFHGVPPDKILKVPIESRQIPKHLVVLGKCKSITYEPLPPTTKKLGEYLHKFGDWGIRFEPDSEPLLCCDSSGKRLFLIGGKYKIKDWIYG